MLVDARQFKGYSGLMLWILGCSLVGPALADSTTLAALKQMSIDDLANLEISIASGRPERFGDTAAAVFVITAEDIRRSGATSLPEVLRMVPGLAVGRVDASSSAVSTRGFQTQGANKLLVLIDGRSIYNAFFRAFTGNRMASCCKTSSGSRSCVVPVR
ncbi:MAG: Plug domain-containing protein [Candidatus Competibacteraceae bacterium]|nr:Plug domain-containing protein [Candidatus Competibacteraceae bacterium]